MKVEEAEKAAKAYQYYSEVLRAISAVDLDQEDSSYTKVGLGKTHMCMHAAELWIPRELVNRMLAHAAARAKVKIESLAP